MKGRGQWGTKGCAFHGHHWAVALVSITTGVLLSLTPPGPVLYSHSEFFRTLDGQSLCKPKLLGSTKPFTNQRQTIYLDFKYPRLKNPSRHHPL